MKFTPLQKRHPDQPDYIFICPGCGIGHGVWVNGPHANGSKWDFNGDLERPTINPSLLVRGYNEELGSDYVCHSFIKDGMIQFLGDCTHELAGQTVPLKDL